MPIFWAMRMPVHVDDIALMFVQMSVAQVGMALMLTVMAFV